MKLSTKVLPFLIIVGISLTLTLLVMPTRAGAGVNILSHTGYLDSYGLYHVVGEVQNVGDQAVNTVEVTATFYDSKNVVITTPRFALTMLSVLTAGEKSPFEITLSDSSQSVNVSRYDLSVTSSTTSSIPPGLEISSNSSYVDETNSLHVVGEVRNIATGEASNIKVVVTCYDKEGNVTAAALIHLDQEQPIILNPGQATQFDISLSADRTQYITTYSLTAESNEYALVPEFPLLMSILFAFFALTISAVKLRKYSISRV
jgi:hypothetical protein